MFPMWLSDFAEMRHITKCVSKGNNEEPSDLHIDRTIAAAGPSSSYTEDKCLLKLKENFETLTDDRLRFASTQANNNIDSAVSILLGNGAAH